MAKEETENTNSSLDNRIKKLGDLDILNKVPNKEDFEQPASTNKNTARNNTNTTDPENTTQTTEVKQDPIKTGDVTINIPKKEDTQTNNVNPVTNPPPANPLQPPAYITGNQGPQDIVDVGVKIPVTSGGGNNTPPPPPGGNNTTNNAGLGGNSDQGRNFEIPTSILTANNEDLANWAIDILDQTLMAWFKDRPSINKLGLVALMNKENIKPDIQDTILRRINSWNKAVADKIDLTRDERDALVAALIAILKAHSQIAENLTPEVRAGFLVLLTFGRKWWDSTKAMPDARQLLQDIRQDIKSAPKEARTNMTTPKA